MQREGITESAEWKLYLDGCQICTNEDLLIGDLITGKEIWISKEPPTMTLPTTPVTKEAASLSRASSICSTDNASSVEEFSEEASHTDFSPDDSLNGGSGISVKFAHA